MTETRLLNSNSFWPLDVRKLWHANERRRYYLRRLFPYTSEIRPHFQQRRRDKSALIKIGRVDEHFSTAVEAGRSH